MLEKAKRGDVNAIDAFQKFGEHLGNAIKTIMFSIDPEAVIIGGSVAKSKVFFIDTLMNTVESFPYQKSVEN